MIFVKILTGKTVTLKRRSELKSKIRRVSCQTTESDCAGKELENGDTLSECSIQWESTLHLLFRLQGGTTELSLCQLAQK